MGRGAEPLAGRLLDLPSGRIHVREDGAAGPVVLLVHGFASSLHAFDRIAPLLAEGARVIRADLLGHGHSARAREVGAPAQAAMLSELLAALAVTDVTDVTVVGHSFGADVAIALAERAPAVGGVVVVAQAPDYAGARLPRGAGLLARGAHLTRLSRITPRRALDRTGRFAFAPGRPYVELFDRPDRLALDVRLTSPAVYPAVLAARPRELARRPLDQRLREWGGPALVILGAEDQLYPAGPTLARYAAVPGARVDVLPGCGHSPPLERPRETAALIAGFAGRD